MDDLIDKPNQNPKDPAERVGQFRFTWVDGNTAVVMDDTVERIIFVMSNAQVEALLYWYTQKTNRIIV
jgi:hypothetical protein